MNINLPLTSIHFLTDKDLKLQRENLSGKKKICKVNMQAGGIFLASKEVKSRAKGMGWMIGSMDIGDI